MNRMVPGMSRGPGDCDKPWSQEGGVETTRLEVRTGWEERHPQMCPWDGRGAFRRPFSPTALLDGGGGRRPVFWSTWPGVAQQDAVGLGATPPGGPYVRLWAQGSPSAQGWNLQPGPPRMQEAPCSPPALLPDLSCCSPFASEQHPSSLTTCPCEM